MRKKILLSALTLLLAVSAFAGRAPKYVFLFIGDGMGMNQVNMTEMYRASSQDKYGIDPLLFTTFPVASYATTFSAEKYITDSAASGTAIATGVKTNNAYLGLDPDNNRLVSVAEMAKRSGKKVAILTNVSVNEATPAAFYGHQPTRNNSDELIDDMVASGFDFFSGSGIYNEKRTPKHYSSNEEREEVMRKAGYTVVKSKKEMEENMLSADKVVYMPKGKDGVRNRLYSLTQGELEQRVCLKDMVKSAVEFMLRDNSRKGFFLMAEGGMIDGQCHGNDVRGTIEEVIDLDEAVSYAYDFYLKHPKQTLIVVTADHETGNLHGGGRSVKEYKILENQSLPEGWVSDMLRRRMLEQEDILSWEQTKDFLGEYLGLWKKVEVTPDEEAYLHHIYDVTIAKRDAGSVKDEFDHTDNCVIANEATRILAKKSGIRWGSTSHSSGYVPVYAVGNNCELFNGKNDNTDIFKKITKIAKYK